MKFIKNTIIFIKYYDNIKLEMNIRNEMNIRIII